jgi:16S rRNA processing protein RimM
MGRPHGIAGELYLDGCPLTVEQLRALDGLEWRPVRGGDARPLVLRRVRPADTRMLVTFEGVASREAASALTNGLLWADQARLPDPGPGRSYAWELAGMRVVDPTGRELGVVAEVVFNVGQPLLVLEGAEGRMLPCQPPFMKHLDPVTRTITLDLPAGFDEL